MESLRLKKAVEKEVALGAVASVLVLIGIGWLSYFTINLLIGMEKWVAHTEEVVAALESGQALLAEAEATQRDYLLSGDSGCRTEFQSAAAAVAGWTQRIRELTADNSQTQQRLDRLRPLVTELLARLNAGAQDRPTPGGLVAERGVALKQDEDLMDQIRRQIGTMRESELQLLGQRQSDAHASASFCKAVVMGSGTLAGLLGIVALLHVRRDIGLWGQAQRRLKDSALQVKVANEQLVAANQELEAFSYSVSHDLRAPLRHIDGFVGLLRKQIRGKLDDRETRYLEIIATSARQMGMLIDDLLVFSRMNRTEMRRSKVISDSLLAEAVKEAEADANNREINWKITALPEVQADAAMLRQVWVNLIGNAVKYTRPRKPAEIEVGCSDGPGEWTFFVHDNGVGFDMQYAHKLFGVFQRLHRAEEFEGTGIGLANVRRIISRHGGRTWAEGKPGAGATFYFSLPKIADQPKG